MNRRRSPLSKRTPQSFSAFIPQASELYPYAPLLYGKMFSERAKVIPLSFEARIVPFLLVTVECGPEKYSAGEVSVGPWYDIMLPWHTGVNS
jgi:hypothetical protein